MTLKSLREGYEKTAGFLMLAETVFMLVVSALAVYISAEAINAAADEGTSYYIFAVTFIIGIFLVVFTLIAGVYAFLKKSEGSSAVVRIVGLCDLILSALFTGDVIYLFINDPTMDGDTYNLVICLISLVAGILSVVYSLGAIIFASLSASFHDRMDGKKAAKELPDITKDRFKEINDSIVALSGSVFTFLTFGVTYYLSYQISQYCKADDIPVQWQAVLLNVLLVIVSVAAIALLVSAVVKLATGKKLEGKKIFELITCISSVSILLVMVCATIILVTLIGKDFFIDEDPIYYIIFNIVLMVISLPMVAGALKAALPSVKRN